MSERNVHSTLMLKLFDEYAKARTMEARGLQRFTRHGGTKKGQQGVEQAEHHANKASEIADTLQKLMKTC
jgi:hypothetical protein